MDPNWIAVLATIIGGGGLAGLVSALISKRKVKAESRNLEIKGELAIVGAANELVTMLKEEVSRLQERMTHNEESIRALREENHRLRHEVSELKAENFRLRERLKQVEEFEDEIKAREE